MIEKEEIIRKERISVRGEATTMEREKVWMGKELGVTAEGCAQGRRVGKGFQASSPARPPVLWGAWTASFRLKGLGEESGGEGEVSRKGKRERSE